MKYSLLLLILLNTIYTRQHGRHDFISPECSKVLDTTVCVKNLDSSELVEEHMSNKSENKDEENCTLIITI